MKITLYRSVMGKGLLPFISIAEPTLAREILIDSFEVEIPELPMADIDAFIDAKNVELKQERIASLEAELKSLQTQVEQKQAA